MLRPKKPRKGTKDWYAKELDSLFSEYIRSKGFCERCGSSHALQCAHIVTRGDKFLRWDEANAICLCHSCHNEWGHKHPKEFKDWFKQKYPDRYEHVTYERGVVHKRTLDDYKYLHKSYKTKVEKLRLAKSW